MNTILERWSALHKQEMRIINKLLEIMENPSSSHAPCMTTPTQAVPSIETMPSASQDADTSPQIYYGQHSKALYSRDQIINHYESLVPRNEGKVNTMTSKSQLTSGIAHFLMVLEEIAGSGFMDVDSMNVTFNSDGSVMTGLALSFRSGQRIDFRDLSGGQTPSTPTTDPSTSTPDPQLSSVQTLQAIPQ